MTLSYQLKETVSCLRERVGEAGVGIILGSGLQGLGEEVEGGLVIPYGEIPNFFSSRVEGHRNLLIAGTVGGRRVIILSGRGHYYEGLEPEVITFPVRVLKALGVKGLIVTCSSGGIRDDLEPGDLLFIEDHINLMGFNPLRGMEGEIFVDMSRPYRIDLYEALLEETGEVSLKTGVLAALQGPSYETRAEIRMLKTLGADAVCMSTVPEVIMARFLGMDVMGLSLVTNRAGGGVSHEEVVRVAMEKGRELFRVIKRAVPLLEG